MKLKPHSSFCLAAAIALLLPVAPLSSADATANEERSEDPTNYHRRNLRSDAAADGTDGESASAAAGDAAAAWTMVMIRRAQDGDADVPTGGTFCLTEADCAGRSEAMGMQFRYGDFPTKGCFSKNATVYFSPGAEEEMTDPGPLDGVRERVYCGDGSPPPVGVESTSPPAASAPPFGPTPPPFASSSAPPFENTTAPPFASSALTFEPTTTPPPMSSGTNSPSASATMRETAAGSVATTTGDVDPAPPTPPPQASPSSFAPTGFVEPACLTEEACEGRSAELGMSFVADDGTSGIEIFPTKGCFSKNGVVYFSPGTDEEMSDPSLPGVRERVYCPTAAPTTSPMPTTSAPTKLSPTSDPLTTLSPSLATTELITEGGAGPAPSAPPQGSSTPPEVPPSGPPSSPSPTIAGSIFNGGGAVFSTFAPTTLLDGGATAPPAALLTYPPTSLLDGATTAPPALPTYAPANGTATYAPTTPPPASTPALSVSAVSAASSESAGNAGAAIAFDSLPAAAIGVVALAISLL